MEFTADTIERMRGQVSLENIRKAQDTIAELLPKTPLLRHPVLVEELGVELAVKHENHLPTGAFKIRGGMNYMARLPEDQRQRGIVTATRGNHGQSVALAASQYGVRCVVFVPHGNNPEKNAAIRAYGAELIEHGSDFDEARLRAEAMVDSDGLTFVHPANEPDLINGVGTCALEIYEEFPGLDVYVVPLGGGSGTCGAITVLRALKPEARIIAVQAENASAIHDSWKAGSIVTTKTADTFADGLALRVPFALPFEIIRDQIDDIVLVSEEEIRDAVRLYLRATHNLAEGAGAAPLAAIKKMASELKGLDVVAVLSGGNIDAKTLRWVLAE
jgi:threonine dehydratase